MCLSLTFLNQAQKGAHDILLPPDPSIHTAMMLRLLNRQRMH